MALAGYDPMAAAHVWDNAHRQYGRPLRWIVSSFWSCRNALRGHEFVGSKKFGAASYPPPVDTGLASV